MNDLIATLIAMSGDENVLVVRRPFVEFTGSLETGMMLGQLLYWTGKGRSAEDGFVAKTDKQWASELYLSRRAVRQSRVKLEKMGILETKVMRWQGSPTVHYRIIQEALRQQWIIWLRTMDCPNWDEPSSQNARTGPEITSEVTSKEDPSLAYTGAQLLLRAARKRKGGTKGDTVPKIIETFRETAEKTISLPPEGKPAQVMFSTLANICQINLETITGKQRGQLNQVEKVLRQSGATPKDLDAFKEWWESDDYRRKNGWIPLPAQVQEHWGRFLAAGKQPGDIRSKPNNDESTSVDEVYKRMGLRDFTAERIKEEKEKNGRDKVITSP